MPELNIHRSKVALFLEQQGEVRVGKGKVGWREGESEKKTEKGSLNY